MGKDNHKYEKAKKKKRRREGRKVRRQEGREGGRERREIERARETEKKKGRKKERKKERIESGLGGSHYERQLTTDPSLTKQSKGDSGYSCGRENLGQQQICEGLARV